MLTFHGEGDQAESGNDPKSEINRVKRPGFCGCLHRIMSVVEMLRQAIISYICIRFRFWSANYTLTDAIGSEKPYVVGTFSRL